MKDVLGPGTLLGYCTNVHPGNSLEQVQANLEHYSLAVKKQVSPDRPMGIGLWLSAQVARQLIDRQRIAEFTDWLQQRDLLPFTLNGFPYGDFHQPIVKHRVYQPDWRDPRRLSYTKDLISVLASLLTSKGDSPILDLQKSGQSPDGSISTLPIAWREPSNQGNRFALSNAEMEVAVGHLHQAIRHLADIEQKTGRLIHLDIEPEPGCVLQTSEDVVNLFEHHLDRFGCPQQNRRYLRVCLDTCHEAVMFQDEQETLQRYDQAEIKIGKVQISSAVDVNFDTLAPHDQHTAIEVLSQFQETRYLHQTVIRAADHAGNMTSSFYEDLPTPLAMHNANTAPGGHWRVHYHVPLYLDAISALATTNRQALRYVQRVREQTDTQHFEIETYAWDVLPDTLREASLADAIAREMTWFLDQVTTEVG